VATPLTFTRILATGMHGACPACIMDCSTSRAHAPSPHRTAAYTAALYACSPRGERSKECNPAPWNPSLQLRNRKVGPPRQPPAGSEARTAGQLSQRWVICLDIPLHSQGLEVLLMRRSAEAGRGRHTTASGVYPWCAMAAHASLTAPGSLACPAAWSRRAKVGPVGERAPPGYTRG